MILKIGSKYLFDTSVFIHAFRKDKAAQSIMFQARFQGISAGYSVVTETELWVNIAASRFLTSNQQRIMLRPFKRYFINVTIARRAGELRGLLMKAGVQRSEGPGLMDCLIAATGEYYGLTICTRNIKDFQKFHTYKVAPHIDYEVY